MGMKLDSRQSRIAEEAADWLLQLESEPGAQTQAAFVEWLKHSPRHVDEFLLMSATLRVARTGGRASNVDIEALIRQIQPDVAPLHAATPSRDRPFFPRRKLYFAAAAVALVAVASVLAMTWPDTYSTPTGEQRSLKLADGSLVYLNTGSRVEVDYTDARRNVILLEGEALFVAAHDPARPFRVLSGAAVVRAVGTQFNVYRRPDITTVSVVEGRVKVEHADRSEALDIGEQATITADGRIQRQAGANVANSVAWRQRRLVFQADTLEDIAREFNRYNSMRIRIEGEAKQRRFTAVFNADEPQALLVFLKDDPALEIEAGEDETVIWKR